MMLARCSAASLRLYAASVLLFFAVAFASGFARAQDGFHANQVFSGLTLPVAMEFAPDGRIFVVEKAGVLLAYDGLSDPTPTVVFDLSAQVNEENGHGFLGLAIDPDFPTTPYVYGLYTYNGPSPHGNPNSNSGRLSRWEVDAQNQVVGGEVVLLHNWCQNGDTHSIGDLMFGPDGYLYASAGDGARASASDWGQNNNACNDPPFEGGSMRSQDLLTSVGGEANDPVDFDGTIIRIQSGTGAAAPDNPLVGGEIVGDAPIIAHGLRNPYRMTFQPGTGRLFIGDVGGGKWEEINVIEDVADAAVENFGWPCWEGTGEKVAFMTDVAVCQDLRDGVGNWVADLTPTESFFQYDHSLLLAGCRSGGSAVSGLAFPSDEDFPAQYTGALFFADYARGCLFAMKVDPNDGELDPADIELLDSTVAIVDMTTGPNGALYFVDIIAGAIYQLKYTGTNGEPLAVVAADITSGEVPLEVNFDGSGSSDPDNDELTMAWDFDSDGVLDAFGATANYTYTTPGSYMATLHVTDTPGATTIASVWIHASNTPPLPTILFPVDATRWVAGENLYFEGIATDAEDGDIPASQLDWRVLFHHCPDGGDCHIHILRDNITGVASGEVLTEDHEFPSWLEIVLTATDSTGASTSTSVIAHPKTALLSFETDPAGLDLVAGLDPFSRPTPFTVEAIVGGLTDATAPSPQNSGGVGFVFDFWSDGGAQSHQIVVPDSEVTYTASYLTTDSTAPELTLLGPTPLKWPLGVAFVDPGARAEDSVDGTWIVTGTGGVDVAMAGVYSLSYQASDQAGNYSPVLQRDVVVEPVARSVSIPDTDGDLENEFAVALYVDEAYTVILRNEESGSLAAQFDIPSAFALVDLEATPAGDLAILLIRLADNQGVVRLITLPDGSTNDLMLGAADSFNDLAVLGDGKLAVLGTRLANAMVRVHIVDPGAPPPSVTTVPFGESYSGDALAVTPQGGVAVLGTHKTDAGVRVRVYEQDSGNVSDHFFGSDFSGQGLAVSTSGWLAVLGTSSASSLTRVVALDPASRSRAVYSFGSSMQALALRMRGEDPAVLMVKDAAVRVRIVDALTRAATFYGFGDQASAEDFVFTESGRLGVLLGKLSASNWRMAVRIPPSVSRYSITFP